MRRVCLTSSAMGDHFQYFYEVCLQRILIELHDLANPGLSARRRSTCCLSLKLHMICKDNVRLCRGYF